MKGTVTITGEWDDGGVRQEDERDKDLIYKNCASLTGKTRWIIPKYIIDKI